MSDLDLVRDLFPEQGPDSAVRERVRAAVAAVTTSRKPLRRRPRWFVPVVGGTCAVATVSALFLFAGTGGTGTAEAARVLRAAAKTARSEPPLGQLGPSQYLYTKSVDAYLDSYYIDHSTSYSALVPFAREIWLRRDGTGWLKQTSGTPLFLSGRDRQAWIASGRQPLGDRTMDVELRTSVGPTTPMVSLDLPTDPDALHARLRDETKSYGSWQNQEMFTMIGDALRENYTTPAQRAALFEVAARVPGIVYVGDVTDSAGRAGVAVAMDESPNTLRDELIFAKGDYTFLAEEERVLPGNPSRYPAGTVIGHATYVEQRVVDSVPAPVIQEAAKG